MIRDFFLNPKLVSIEKGHLLRCAIVLVKHELFHLLSVYKSSRFYRFEYRVISWHLAPRLNVF